MLYQLRYSRKFYVNYTKGITKTRERAHQSVWWPGLNSEIANVINICTKCCKERYQSPQPLLPSVFPELPWQCVATVFFDWKSNTYLLVVDYFSRYIEIAKLNHTTSEEVINQLKSIFARHGIPQILRSDNGPQYSSHLFNVFAEIYGVQHITSSPN